MAVRAGAQVELGFPWGWVLGEMIMVNIERRG